MKKYSIIMMCLLTCLWVSSSEVAQSKREVVLDNDAVLVVRLTYPPGTESGMHTHEHPNRVVYFIKGGLLELQPEDSQKPVNILNASDGKTLYLPAATHNVKNVGNSNIILLETEIKKK
jgi:quercetin dioxygenase-like cupin family protein